MYHCNVSIDVPDLASAVRFYIEAFRLRLKGEPIKGMVVLQTINLDVYLLEKAGETQACSDSSTQRVYSRHWTPVHLDFIVSNLSSALERAVAAGANHEGCDKGDRGEIAYYSDPFGNGFCLIEK